MHCAKALTTGEIAEAYGINCEYSKQDEAVSFATFREISPDFDKYAIIHWLMCLGTGFSSRPASLFDHWSSVANSVFNYMTVLKSLNQTGDQPQIGFKPHRRHPIQMQIDDIETWLPFIRPENTSQFGLIRKIEVWDKNRQARHKYTMLIRDNGRVETVIGKDVTHTGVDIFDSVHWLKDNLPYSTEPFCQELEQPRIVFRQQRSIAEILSSYSSRAVRQPGYVMETAEAQPLFTSQPFDIQWSPPSQSISGVTSGFATTAGPATGDDLEDNPEDENDEEPEVDESEDEDGSL